MLQLLQALRSRERRVRFCAAALLSRLGPGASDAVPALLPLLDECFDPATPYERGHPERADAAVAAISALGWVAPGTGMADAARESLTRVVRNPKYPWRGPEAAQALARLGPVP